MAELTRIMKDDPEGMDGNIERMDQVKNIYKQQKERKIMYHDPGSVIFAWIFSGLSIVIIIVSLRDFLSNKKKHDIYPVSCHHRGVD